MIRHAPLLVLLAGCLPGSPEGSNPGECLDGIDNDVDGYFDCNDLDCFAFTDCGGTNPGGTGTGTGTGGTDDPGITGEAIAAHLTSFTVEYTMAMDLESTVGVDLCSAYALCDCTNSYSGAGTQVAAADDNVTFSGTWTLTATDCTKLSDLEHVIWFPETGTSFHTVHFGSGLATMDEWIAHGDQADVEALDEPSSNQQFWITSMNAPYDDASKVLVYYEYEEGAIDAFTEIAIDHDATFTFNQ